MTINSVCTSNNCLLSPSTKVFDHLSFVLYSYNKFLNTWTMDLRTYFTLITQQASHICSVKIKRIHANIQYSCKLLMRITVFILFGLNLIIKCYCSFIICIYYQMMIQNLSRKENLSLPILQCNFSISYNHLLSLCNTV